LGSEIALPSSSHRVHNPSLGQSHSVNPISKYSLQTSSPIVLFDSVASTANDLHVVLSELRRSLLGLGGAAPPAHKEHWPFVGVVFIEIVMPMKHAAYFTEPIIIAAPYRLITL
jgi:hypothetical protein